MRRNEIKDRIHQVLLKDKIAMPERLNELIKSDVYSLLTNYMVIPPENIAIAIDITENGNYAVRISAIGERLKNFGQIID